MPVSKGKHDLAKPNYQYEKRQRELAKKAKKAEKAARKAAGKPDEGDAPDSEDTGVVQGGQADAAGGAAPGEGGTP